MSSATFDASTKRYAAANSATLWRHLLWKDFRQVWQLIIGIAVIAISLQLMFGLMQMLFPNEMAGLASNSINIALASPTLLAIACCGVLIGQERQTGCWTWSTSLPVSWQQSLISKTLVWLGSSVCMMVILLVFASIVLAMNHTSIGTALASGPDLEAWTHLMTLIIGVQVFIYLAIATLLLKDSLMAIVIAAFGLFAFHLQIAIVGIGYNLNHENTVLIAYLASFVVGSIGLAATYRWRWGSGQFTSISLLPSRSQRYLRPQRAAWQSYAGSATQPSELWMLMQHGFRSAFWLRVIAFGGTIAFLSQEIGLFHFGPMVASLASCVLGVSVFSGDQILKRYRFFADRGVDWRKLFVSHAMFPGLLTILLVLYAAFATTETNSGCLICIPIFVVGMFSSLVFASPIVSITVALTVLCGAFAFSASAIAVWEQVTPGHWMAIAIWIPVATLLVLAATIRLVPLWLTKDRLDATGTYFGTMLVAGLLPSVLGLSFGFLQIPKVAWQGTPIEQIKGIDWSGGPDLKAWSTSSYFASANRFRTRNLSTELAASELIENIQKEIHQKVHLESWLAREGSLLETIESGGPQPKAFDYQASATLNAMLEGSAVLALMATEQRQKELAIRAWKANRKLIGFCQQPALQPATMQSVCFVWEIWNTLNDGDLQFLVNTNQLEELIPVPCPSLEEFREVLRARATLHRMISNPNNNTDVNRFSYTSNWFGYTPLQIYPPIRWAYERQHAIALSRDLGVTLSPGNLQEYAGFRDPFVREYSVLTFLDESFAGRLIRLQNAKTLGQIRAPETETSTISPLPIDNR